MTHPIIEPELVERIARNRDTLRYFLNWEDRPRTQIGTLYRTFSRYDGEDCSVNSKDQLEQLYADTEKAADAITALQDRIRRLDGVLTDVCDRVSCPVCVTPSPDEIAEIIRTALNGSPDQ